MQVDSYNEVIRQNIITGLMFAGSEQDYDLIRPYLAYGYARGLRPALGQAALNALVVLRPDAPATAEILVQTLSHPSQWMRQSAVQWIDALKLVTAMPALVARQVIEPRPGIAGQIKNAIKSLKEWQGEAVPEQKDDNK